MSEFNFLYLPDETIYYIICFTDLRTVLCLMSVNKKFYSLALNNNHWRLRAIRRWNFFNTSIGGARAPKRTDTEYEWRNYVLRRLVSDKNWTTGICTTKNVSAHVGDASIAANQNYIFSGGQHDGELKVWDKDLNLMSSTLAHKSWIKVIEAREDETIISGSTDFQVKIWSVKEGNLQALHTFTNERGIVVLQSKKNILACGCSSRFTVWDIDTGTKTLEYTVGGNYHRVEHLHMIDQNICITAASDYIIRQWDLRTKSCVKEYQSHQSKIFGMKIHDSSYTMVSSCFSNLNVWDLKMQSLQNQFDAKDYHICSIDFNYTKQCIVTGGSIEAKSPGIYIWDLNEGNPTLFGNTEDQHNGGRDAYTKIWDIETGTMSHSRSFMDGWVTNLIVMDDILITSSGTGTVMLMDFSPKVREKKCFVQ